MTRCNGAWKNICDLTYNPADLVCIACENLRKEWNKERKGKG